MRILFINQSAMLRPTMTHVQCTIKKIPTNGEYFINYVVVGFLCRMLTAKGINSYEKNEEYS